MHEFKDVTPLELPKKLLLRHVVDHKIELVLGIRSPTKAFYGISPKELIGLKKQLREPLE